ncbi:MAG: hypothetical protein R2874_13090 [Desulfobacterales bacterium]
MPAATRFTAPNPWWTQWPAARAAESIHRFINDLDLAQGREKIWEYEKPDIKNEPLKSRTQVRCLDPEARECNFLEVSFGYNETEAKNKKTDRCLKCGICSECYQCLDACLAGAIDHTQQAVEGNRGSGVRHPLPGQRCL